MWGPREVLNELKWRHDALGEAHLYYVHRGAPGDVADADGRDVVGLGRSFLELRKRRVASPRAPSTASIPYHRVLRIERAGRVVWERRGATVPDLAQQDDRDDPEDAGSSPA